MACLCAPTSHEGSFRCRLHRAPANPAQSSANHLIKAVNYGTDSYNASSNQIGCAPYVTVRESPSASVLSTPHLSVDHHNRCSHTPQVAADQSTVRTRLVVSSSSSDTFASSSSSLSHRLPSSSLASSASSRAPASSSSSLPSAPIFCMRPPPVKRSTSSVISLPSNRIPSPSSSSSSSWCGASGSSSPSASHAAALAIMKQHTHNRHGARTHSRNPHSPMGSAPRIGPSRLSRMAVACAADKLPLLQEERYVSSSPRCRSSTPDAFSASLADTPSGRASVETAQIKAMQIGGLKTRSTVNKFKQSESSCRIVGSKEGSLIMPTVY